MPSTSIPRARNPAMRSTRCRRPRCSRWASTSPARSQAITVEMVRHADVVITLGRDATVRQVPGTRFETWDTDEPSVRGIDGMQRMRLVRDDITARVRGLADTLRGES